MITDLGIDKLSKDLSVVDGDLQLVSELSEINQHVTTRLRFFYGEWVFDTSIGVPYYETILVPNPNLAQIEAVLKKTISDTNGVKDILDFSLSFDKDRRTLGVSFTASTDLGLLKVSDLALGVS
jgi:hypothetical protein